MDALEIANQAGVAERLDSRFKVTKNMQLSSDVDKYVSGNDSVQFDFATAKPDAPSTNPA
jgi:hypothetical protein